MSSYSFAGSFLVYIPCSYLVFRMLYFVLCLPTIITLLSPFLATDREFVKVDAQRRQIHTAGRVRELLLLYDHIGLLARIVVGHGVRVGDAPECAAAFDIGAFQHHRQFMPLLGRVNGRNRQSPAVFG